MAKAVGSLYADYLKSKSKSLWGYVRGVVYTNNLGFYKIIPCENKTNENTGRSLRHFIEVFDLTYSLHSDNNRNFKDGLFKRLIDKFGIFQTFTEPHSPWKNGVEPAIGEIKIHAWKIMQDFNKLVRLCFFNYEYLANLFSLLANVRFELQGKTPYESVIYYTPDILECVLFEWFKLCW